MARKPPAYTHHKSSGQARVRINGHDHYLGEYGSPESHQKYERLIAEWRAGVPTKSLTAPTITELVDCFLQHNTPDLERKGELAGYLSALKPLLRLYELATIAEFRARQLRTVQAEMVRLDWCRNYINRAIKRIRTMFRWLESEELVPAGTWEHLRTVRALELGQARETADVLPVPEPILERTLPELPPIIRAMADTQLLTGARPAEVIGLRPESFVRADLVDIAPGFPLDTRGLWVVMPKQHKTAGKGVLRVLLFGPRAQTVLAPYLDRPADKPLFSPREADQWYLERAGRRKGKRRSREPGEQYLESSYYHAIQRACRRAQVEPWAPNQLRHNAASRLAAQFGDELARIILGHTAVATTYTYILRDLAKAVAAMREVG